MLLNIFAFDATVPRASATFGTEIAPAAEAAATPADAGAAYTPASVASPRSGVGGKKGEKGGKENHLKVMSSPLPHPQVSGILKLFLSCFKSFKKSKIVLLVVHPYGLNPS